MLQGVEEQSERRRGTLTSISPTGCLPPLEIALSDVRWFITPNKARREGGYAHSRRIWEWVPSGRRGKLARKRVDGAHPYCVVVGTEKLSVDFLNGVHTLTGVPELTVHCVETAKVILLDTLFDDDF
jgi:hypothetical protein